MPQTTLTRAQNIAQAVKFTLFSAGAGIIQIAVFTLAFELIKLPNRLSYFIALVCSVLFNFTVKSRLHLQISQERSIGNAIGSCLLCGFHTALHLVAGPARRLGNK